MTVFDTKVFGFLWYAYTAEQTEKHTAIGHNAYSSCASWSFRTKGQLCISLAKNQFIY